MTDPEPTPLLSRDPASILSRPQEVAAVLLVVWEVVILIRTVGPSGVLLALLLFAVGSIPVRYRVNLGNAGRFRLFALLSVGFILKSRIAPVDLEFNRRFVASEQFIGIAEALMVCQVTLLWLSHRSGRLPFTFGGLGIAALIFGSNLQIAESERLRLQFDFTMATLFLAAFCWFSRHSIGPARTRKLPKTAWIVVGLLCLVVTGGAWAGAGKLHSYEQQLDGFIVDLLRDRSRNSAVGFSGTARLGSVMRMRNQGGDGIALRISSEARPDYLRGLTFHRYADGAWSREGRGNPVRPVPPNRGLAVTPRPGDTVFPLESSLSVLGSEMTIWHDVESDGTLFCPLGSTSLAAPLPQLSRTASGVAHSQDVGPGMSYRVHVSSERPVDPSADRKLSRDLALPAELDPRIPELAQQLCADCETDAEKIERIATYFRVNGQYQFGIDVPPNIDPLVYFLTNNPPAHCEYFASATAILLRCVNVPARYVTGFVAIEQNSFSGEWTVRNRHAHAWVEAHTDKTGWITVESTPPAGLPQQSEQIDKPSQFGEAITSWFRRTRTRWAEGGWAEIRSDLWAVLTGPLGWLLVGWISLRTWRWYAGRSRKRRPTTIRSDAEEKLNSLWQRVERKLARREITRNPNETLTRFASRLRSEAGDELAPYARWITEYAAIRYRPTVTDGDRERLEQMLP